jgi:MFS family permease
VVWSVFGLEDLQSVFVFPISNSMTLLFTHSGAIFVGHYADRIGRLKTIELGCLWGILGAALQASAQNFTWIAFARIIGGVGCRHFGYRCANLDI